MILQIHDELENRRKALEEERADLENQLQTLEVERNTLRVEHEALEETKAALEKEKEELHALQESLQAERDHLDKKTYEITQQEFSLEEKQRTLETSQSENTASSEELQSQLQDLETREAELLKNSNKLQEDIETLQQQQKDLATRQAIYNQQQYDFVTRKNALSSQQFEFAEKLSAYNSQVKLFNENLEKLEAERAALHNERQQYETEREAFNKAKAQYDEDKAKFDKDKEEFDNERKDSHRKSLEDQSGIQTQLFDLQERERLLQRRESDLNERIREFNARQLRPTFGEEYPEENAYGHPTQPRRPQNMPPQNESPYDYLRDRAQADGIKVNTAGNMRNSYSAPAHNEPTYPPEITSSVKKNGCYNVGLTLYKTALIIFCITAFESLVVFFLKDALKVSPAYPAIGFALGFATFIACTILHAYGYRAHARRKKNPSYILTSAIIFVISVILISMVAVYSKAQMSDPAQLFAFVIIPVLYMANILIFALFYHLFATREAHDVR